MKITLSNVEYTLLTDYRKQDKYRIALNALVKSIFGISFEDWYQSGYWNEKYIPYTLFDQDKAVANASINIMDFNVFGKRQRYIQIGTVLTDEKYRGKNLSRFLMNTIMDEWSQKCDLIYLFANKSALGMYPKFGFDPVEEYEYFKPIEKNRSGEKFEKLNMDIQSNKDKLYFYAKNSIGFGKFFMQENADLVMFYCASPFMKENVFYIKSLDVIAIATFNDNQLHLLDVFGQTDVDLDKIIYSLANSSIDEVRLGFTPTNPVSYKARIFSGDDTLFIQQNKTNLFDKNKIMFPVLSHA